MWTVDFEERNILRVVGENEEEPMRGGEGLMKGTAVFKSLNNDKIILVQPTIVCMYALYYMNNFTFLAKPGDNLL